MGTLNQWVDTWDQRIANWVAHGPGDDMELGDIVKAYQGNRHTSTELQMGALPEPYVGDPLSRDLDVVFLMLNPGNSGCAQWHPNGRLVELVKASSYYSVASRWGFPCATTKWWYRRSRWPTRLMDPPTGVAAGGMHRKPKIVGIDLVPWHSRKWGKMDVSAPSVRKWCRDNVLAPAAEMAAESRLRRMARDVHRPLVLAVGAQYAHLLRELGFSIERAFDQGSGQPDWPTNSSGCSVNRSIRLFVSDCPSMAVLQTDAPGGFRPPARGFDPIVRQMLGMPEPGR